MSKEPITEAERRQIVVENMMRSVEGRAWFKTQLDSMGVGYDKFNADPYQNAYNMGLQAAGVRLSQELQLVNIDLYLTMIKEAG